MNMHRLNISSHQENNCVFCLFVFFFVFCFFFVFVFFCCLFFFSGITSIHICLVDPSSILINWTSPFPILGVSGVLFSLLFYFE